MMFDKLGNKRYKHLISVARPHACCVHRDDAGDVEERDPDQFASGRPRQFNSSILLPISNNCVLRTVAKCSRFRPQTDAKRHIGSLSIYLRGVSFISIHNQFFDFICSHHGEHTFFRHYDSRQSVKNI